ncbi:hypothetical protein DL765_007957 [Monosporascus sp. GIB2]|nr:hypothetical protein DL765_007957 [Monosporascus sp. GIB2]
MATSTSQPALGRTILLFGPQFLLFTADSLAQLRAHCLESPGLYEWVLRTLAELPHHWATIEAAFPSFEQLSGEQQLNDVIEALRTGNAPEATFPLPNLLLCPLVVVLQLTQYLRYRDIVQPRDARLWQPDVKVESAGFCTGLLSAFAVSCSTTRKQLEQHGAAAVRLAMLIGAFVDARNHAADSGDTSVSFSAGWQSANGKAELDRILEAFPEAYISVSYDEGRATVTTLKRDSSILCQKLKDAGITAVEIGLQGRFHDPGHSSDVRALVEFCDSHTGFALPNASRLILPTRCQGADRITEGSLHDIALRAILVDHCQWYQTFTAIHSEIADGQGSIISFGLDRCIPPSYSRGVGSQLLHAADADFGKAQPNLTTNPLGGSTEDYIAVIGMSSRVPGADDLESFWDILCEARSQHVEVPPERFTFETAWRDVDPKRKWFGNFVQDHDAFDNKFFNRSPREAMAMDPQQKMMMQAAYQAVEQAGYFNSPDVDKKIGCYIGVSNVDYLDNVACHPVSAFTATGTLMAFVAGKISHFFGWTGPSINIDTACSGSAVAIHEACKAILNGDCKTALAGGVNAMTSCLWFQNLAGASFLSQTGQCKPFDAKGDGYCRGEAVGAVYLKRLSDAMADGDVIFGTIAATAVFQNQNCTAITVPNSPSLSDLFMAVSRKAKIEPHAITVAEAHGTGTAVGDPAEYDAIRSVLGGKTRSSTLALGSVKGLVGHAECASGIVALIKVLLMIHESAIVPQASHTTLNPALHAMPSDKIEIPTRLKPWEANFKAALINNYGAAGSNASMVVTEAPIRRTPSASSLADSARSLRQPFWFCGTDNRSLEAYVSRFLSFLRLKKFSARHVSLPSLSFNVARQSNRSLGRALIFHADSSQDLEARLNSFCRGEVAALDVAKPPRPIILCFGGQVSTFVGLSRQVAEQTTILKKHLDQCDLVCKSMGLPGIYPAIYQRAPIEDTVQLQTALFALQYSCAQSWIDCGVQVAAVVGHSFGEIVAQTVAGAMTLTDGLKVIARRARLIRDSWGPDRGSMMAVEADLEVAEDLVARANKREPCDGPASIACFNGPRSFTLAGSVRSIQSVEAVLAERKDLFGSLRTKKLNTSHAFHSTLVASLIPQLEQISHDITFSEPRIRVERATKEEFQGPLPATYIAEHLRQPVYFNHAVQRLAKDLDGAVWIEAGSRSTVTAMASKALGAPKTSHFQAMDLTSDDSWQRLCEATVALWKQGVKVAFWPHHVSQTAQYTPLILPPYQFEKNKHFLPLKTPRRTLAESNKPVPDPPSCSLFTFMGYSDGTKQSGRFRVESTHETFQELMAGHTVAHSQPLCPSTLQLNIAVEAVRSLCPELTMADFQLDLGNLENQAPICRDGSRVVWLDVVVLDHPSRRSWSWKMVSTPVGGSDAGPTLHASGNVVFRPRDDAAFLAEFRRWERLVTHRRCREILDSPQDSDEILQGGAIYTLFSDVVDYGKVFQGVRKVVGRGLYESAGRVVKKYSDETWLDTPLCDSFCQVAGVFVNCMTQRPDSDAFISNGIERVIRSPLIRDFEEAPRTFDVYALHHRPTDRSYSSDVFVFDTNTSRLLGVILGIGYQRVSKLAMAKLLARLTPGAEQPRLATSASTTTTTTTTNINAAPAAAPASSQTMPAQDTKVAAPKPAQSAGSQVAAKIRAILCEMVGVEADKITDSTNLVELGIDSLMGMEISRELETVFNCTLDMSSMMTLTLFGELVSWVRSAQGEEVDDSSPGRGGDAASAQVQLGYQQHDDSDEASDSTASSSSSSSSVGRPESPDVYDDVSESAPGTSVPPSGAVSPKKPYPDTNTAARQMTVDLMVAKYSSGFSFPSRPTNISRSETVSSSSAGHCVLVTGATGSLGGHLVQHLAELPSVATVVCFNRPSGLDPMTRQRQSLAEKGVVLDERASAKLRVIASDTSKPFLGLDEASYSRLAGSVTHIIHNAWPMSITRPIAEFEKQFAAMRNLLDLARDASYKLPSGTNVGFQFVSSIATVGLYPVVTGNAVVPEEPSSTTYALSSGYSDAKLVCERLLSETLGRYPERATAMAVRVGQIAGSRTKGFWSPSEHFPLLVKSAQTVNALPDLPGHLSWLPVNDVAAALSDLVLETKPPLSSVLHVENPARQPWCELTSLLAADLGIPSSNIIPYQEWLDRVRNFPQARGGPDNNPAKRVMPFLENEFLRMACGGLVLGMDKAVQSSETLRRAEPVEMDLVKSYLRAWRDMGFLQG